MVTVDVEFSHSIITVTLDYSKLYHQGTELHASLAASLLVETSPLLRVLMSELINVLYVSDTVIAEIKVTFSTSVLRN
jgi:hypothetical protein